MENANPPLSPVEVARMRGQIEGQIRDLRDFNKLVTLELNYALKDLAVAIEHNKDFAPKDFAIVKVEEKKEEEVSREYFDLFPTKEELAYHKNLIDNPRPSFIRIIPKVKRGDPNNIKIPCMIGYKFIANAYIDLESPINVMSRAVYNDIVNKQLESRRDPKHPGKICNFVGRVNELRVFVGNFICVANFMILEDVVSAIDCNLSQVVLGREFVEDSRLKYDKLEGTIQFANEHDKITYRMPSKMKELRFVPQLDKDHISAFEDIPDEANKLGMNYALEKRSLYYKDCLHLGPRYKVDEEFVRKAREAIRRKIMSRSKESLEVGPEYNTGREATR